MNYKIISSGSKGNAVIINDVLVDCGVAFKTLKDELYDIRYLLLTHIHSDHVKAGTLKSIKTKFPHITIIGNYQVHESYGVDLIINAGFPLNTEDYIFNAFECNHDVITYGFYWQTNENEDVFYATDTSDLNNVEKGLLFDYIFVESNHDHYKLEATRNNTVTRGYDPYLSGKRHLSTQKAKEFYLFHRKHRDVPFIELHKSERFY
ncbi:MBL fold metallo-hydrolase [Mammaliicoccus sciuri]|uniref:MBL fold metallo-hydrolase n=1 Tax=Mammaliicoccus sciuri TaxID=1296 RepID=UPI002DB8C215|nr:MBL fold metallo-hydrolase [Mammaliicoccus sciuri]MEB5757438.1 hypothetical protein [Mammaliicoccus sciuri]